MESQPQNPEFWINPENFHPCNVHYFTCSLQMSSLHQWKGEMAYEIYLNAKETQLFSIHFFFHMDHMRLISWLYPEFLRIK